MPIQPKPLPFTSLRGISDKTLAIHHDKLYAGYVAKENEIVEKIIAYRTAGSFADANQTYSELRALKDGETFASNGVTLHERYFEGLGGDGKPDGALVDALAKQYGSIDTFIAYFSACGMAARGWTILAWDTNYQSLRILNADAHHQGGVWGCLPLLVLDVYEHAYFIDYGSDRKTYIADWWKNLNWNKANELYKKATTI